MARIQEFDKALFVCALLGQIQGKRSGLATQVLVAGVGDLLIKGDQGQTGIALFGLGKVLGVASRKGEDNKERYARVWLSCGHSPRSSEFACLPTSKRSKSR